MVNKVTLIGNLGRDPEIRRLESGAAVAKFSVATNENYKDKNGEWQTQTEWHDVVVWRTLAERAERDLKKGSMIYLEGKLTHRKWEDKDGNSRKTTEVVGNYFRILNRREAGGGDSSYFPTEEYPNAETSNTKAPASVQANGGPANSEAEAPVDDDLPF